MSAAVVQVTVALGASREEVVEPAAWPLGGLEARMASGRQVVAALAGGWQAAGEMVVVA